MAVGAFGDKLFEVNQDRIYTPDGISGKESLNMEQQETDGGKPATYIKGLNAMDMSFSITLKYPFCDVQSEIDWWLVKLRSRTPEYLTIGEKTYGTNKMLLNDVGFDDVVIVAGKTIKAILSLSFSEWTKAGYKKDTTTSSSTSKNTSKKTSSSSGDNTAQAVKNQQIVSGV